MSKIVRIDAKCGVSVEVSTEGVPDDGRYHVVVDGEIVLSTRVEAAAVAEFEDIQGQRREARSKRLREEQGAAAYRAMRSASWAERNRRDARRSRPLGSR